MSIYIVVLVVILNQASFSGSRIAVSLYALELGANQFALGAIISLYSLSPLLMSIVIGRFADRVAPRTPMIVSSIAMVGAFLLPTMFASLATLYVLGVLLGLLHQIFSIPVEAVVGGLDGPDKRARNYALITMAWSIANFVGPVIAGFSIDYIGHRQVFPVLAALAAAPIFVLWLNPGLFPRVTKHREKEVRVSVADLWRIPALRITFITGGIIGSAQDLFQFYMPIYGHSLGISASAIGTILGMVAAAAFVIRAIVPFLIKKLSESQLLRYSIFFAAFAFLLLPFFSNPYALAVIAFVLGLGVGCAQPMMMSLIYVLAPPGRTAEAIGLYKTLRSVTHMGVPLLFGSVGAAFGFGTVFVSNSVMLAGGGLWMRKAHRPVKI